MLDWKSLLVGVAITLGVVIVIFALVSLEDDPVQLPGPTCGGCCCGGGGGSGPGADRVLWLDAGKEVFYCTNNDSGGGYVMDSGGGYVMDNGDGALVVEAPRSPAPGDNYLPGSRGLQQFQCQANDSGGGYVMDGTGHNVTVPIREADSATEEYFCVRHGDHAVIVDKNDYKVQFNYRGNPVVQYSDGPISIVGQKLPYTAAYAGSWHFCTIIAQTGGGTALDVAIVDKDGVVKAP